MSISTLDIDSAIDPTGALRQARVGDHVELVIQARVGAITGDMVDVSDYESADVLPGNVQVRLYVTRVQTTAEALAT